MIERFCFSIVFGVVLLPCSCLPLEVDTMFQALQERGRGRRDGALSPPAFTPTSVSCLDTVFTCVFKATTTFLCHHIPSLSLCIIPFSFLIPIQYILIKREKEQSEWIDVKGSTTSSRLTYMFSLPLSLLNFCPFDLSGLASA